MSTGLYTITTRATGTILTAAIYNADHQNHVTNQNPLETGAYSDSVTQYKLQTDPGGVGTESLAPSLAGELERFRFVLAKLLGTTFWYDYAHLAGLFGNFVNSPGGLTTLKSVTSGSAVEAFLTLLRNKGAGIANDFLEALTFDGMNTTPAQKTFAQQYAQIITATAGVEDGSLLWATQNAGTLAARMALFKGLVLGAATGGDQGAGTLNAQNIYINGQTIVPIFSKFFVSSAQAIPAVGNTLTTAHGLGATPKVRGAYLHNVTGELGWSSGDEPDTENGFICYADATNIYAITNNGGVSTFTKGGGASATITLTNWNMKVYGFL